MAGLGSIDRVVIVTWLVDGVHESDVCRDLNVRVNLCIAAPSWPILRLSVRVVNPDSWVFAPASQHSLFCDGLRLDLQSDEKFGMLPT